MIEIKDLNVKVKDTDIQVLNDFNLNIDKGEIHVIMGPNGAGKSSLSKTIMGHYQYEVMNGSIKFLGEDITKLEVNERAKKGIFLCMQDPTVIEGVSNGEFLRTALGEIKNEKINLYSFVKEMNKTMEKVKLDSKMLHRSLNSGFSGGEKKKNEILQMLILKPKFIILDELDSGLDVDSLRIICDNINNYLKENKDTSVLIITHYTRILEYIKPNYVHVLAKGQIRKTGNYDLAVDIDKNGYTMIGNDING